MDFKLILEVLEYEYLLPRDFPAFCENCRVCACEGLHACPHARYTVPLWENILATDLLVFVLPTYTSNIPIHMKALLDHYYAKFMAHVPEANMSYKQAVVLSSEPGEKSTSLIKESLDQWGVAHTHTVQQPSFDLEWHYVLTKTKYRLRSSVNELLQKLKELKQ